jgi:hypothetical protein
MPAIPLLQGRNSQSSFATGMYGALFAALFMLAVLSVSKYFKRSRRGRIALRSDGVSTLRHCLTEWLAKIVTKGGSAVRSADGRETHTWPLNVPLASDSNFPVCSHIL